MRAEEPRREQVLDDNEREGSSQAGQPHHAQGMSWKARDERFRRDSGPKAGPVICPVCAWPNIEQATCLSCGWLLEGPVLLGAPTGQEIQEFNDALATARQSWDLAAAVRAATIDGVHDRPLCDRLIRQCVRSLPAASSERERLVREMEIESKLESELQLDGMDPILAQLGSGRLDTINLLFLDPESLRLISIHTDALGIPYLDEKTTSWDQLVPNLVPESEIQRFQLSGGHGFVPIDWGELDRSLERRLHDLCPASTNSTSILIHVVAGWQAIDFIAERVRRSYPTILELWVGSNDHDGVGLVDSLLQRIPLRYPCELALAHIDSRTGSVRLVSRLLFDTKTPIERGQSREIAIYAPPVGPERLLLPIVYRCSADPTDWKLVSVGSLDLSSGEAGRVTVTYRGHDDISITAPATVVLEEQSWREIFRSVPSVYSPTVAWAADVVFAVELVGADNDVARRIALVQHVIDAFERALPRPGALEIGLLGYVDHPVGEYGRHLNPVERHGLTDPETAHHLVDRWHAHQEKEDDNAAPLEDAINQLRGFRWRAGSRRLLVTLFARPPHPSMQQPDFARVCPFRFSWQTSLRQAKEHQQLECIAVWGPSPWLPSVEVRTSVLDRLNLARRELGSTGSFDLAQLVPDDIVRAAGLDSPPGSGLIPLPLVRALESRI